MSINQDRLEELQGMVVDEWGATYYAPLVVIGDRLGLYKALDDAGPLTLSELADQTDTAEPYVDSGLRREQLADT